MRRSRASPGRGTGSGTTKIQTNESRIQSVVERNGTNTNSVQLTPGPMVIGAPSLDTEALPKSLLHVGSVDGVFYAVEVPF
jgi:hypothetical protein